MRGGTLTRSPDRSRSRPADDGGGGRDRGSCQPHVPLQSLVIAHALPFGLLMVHQLETPEAGVYSDPRLTPLSGASRSRRMGSAKRLRMRADELVESRRLVRPAGDHDLVGREGRQRIRDRQQRIGVADTTLGVDSASAAAARRMLPPAVPRGAELRLRPTASAEAWNSVPGRRRGLRPPTPPRPSRPRGRRSARSFRVLSQMQLTSLALKTPTAPHLFRLRRTRSRRARE